MCRLKVVTLETLEAFRDTSIFNKAVLHSGEKEGMLLNNECVLEHIRLANFT